MLYVTFRKVCDSNLHYKPVAHTHVKRWRIVSKLCMEQASSVLVNKLHGNRQCEHSYEQTAAVQTGTMLNWRLNLFKMAHKKQFVLSVFLKGSKMAETCCFQFNVLNNYTNSFQSTALDRFTIFQIAKQSWRLKKKYFGLPVRLK
jgi:hypothetical protein